MNPIWNTAITIVCATGIPSVAFSIVLSRVLKAKDERDKAEQKRIEESVNREKAIQDGVCALLRLELRRMHEAYVNQGEITSQDYTLFMQAYNPYHALGGNDIATVYLEDIQNLPVRN